ncbi:MAG: hypothetical protein RL398_182 [Planctomycetota bacterium]|jgi:hypothetical protein
MRRSLPLLPLLLVAVACSKPEPAAVEAVEFRPLAGRAAVAGTRFVQRDPAETGLAFTNELRRENVVAYVYAGAGLAAGDYDGDGLVDLYLVSQDGPNRLFRQVAPLKFADVTAAAGGLDGGDAWGTAASFADIDGDGDLDLYVANLESPNLLYVNRGDGTFGEASAAFGLDTVAATMGVSFADYDNDGDLDVYLLNNRVFGAQVPTEIIAETKLPSAIKKTKRELFPPYPQFRKEGDRLVVPPEAEDFYFTIGERIFVAGQCDRLLRNDGGKFVDATVAAGIDDRGNGLGTVWWDADGDGRLDLYVANDLHSPDKFYHNLGGGRFREVADEHLAHTTFFSMGCDFGDVDGDGDFDLAVADMSSTSHYMGKLLMGNMNTHRWFLENAAPQQYMRNALHINTGTGRFLESAYLANLASTDWTWSFLLRDLDEDGRLDAFASNGITVFTDDPDAGRRFDALWREGKRQQALELYRHLDRMPEKNVARRNLGNLRFADTGAEWGLDEESVGQGAVIVDLDGDGDLDVVVNNQNQPASLFENRTADTKHATVRLRGLGKNTAGIGATIRLTAGGVTQTRMMMTTRGYMSAQDPVEHFGLGEATRIELLEVRWPSGKVSRHRDLPVDHAVVVHESGAGDEPWTMPAVAAARFVADELPAAHRERPHDDYAAQPLLPHKLSQLGPGLACGDVDGDGDDDLYLAGAAHAVGTLLLADGRGGYAPKEGPWAAHADREDLGALFFDADGDGDLDLYVVSGGVEAPAGDERLHDRLYLNDGKASFVATSDEVVAARGDSGSCVVAADFDRDGDLDLFVGGRVVPGRYPIGAPSRLLRNDGGKFVDVTEQVAPQLATAGMVTAATWSDVDVDGDPDLLVAAQWQPLRLHRNEAGLLREATNEWGFGGVSGVWNGLATADLDGDGDFDLVATNLGLNSKYKASTSDPLRIYGQDVDGNGTFDVIEGKQSKGTLLPVRGLSCSSEAIPLLAEKFPTYRSFAKATLGEIYSGALDDCVSGEATTLSHLVFENRGDAFVSKPLPSLAQGSIAFGIGIADFDLDGDLDLVLAENSWSPEPETGRMGGGLGLLLENRGALEFAPVGARESGICVPLDMKALAVLDADRDSRPDFALGINDRPAMAFGNATERAGLAVRLRGGVGNPTAIGAVVSIAAKDGRTQVRELGAGAGYLSQAAAVAFFADPGAGATATVRWPDGVRTTHELPKTRGEVTLSR